MIIRFSISNFLSFGCEDDYENGSQEFSMISGNVRTKKNHLYIDENLKLLKLASIYGANASGKSNLVKAMSFFKQCLIQGLPIGTENKFCKLKETNKGQPSYFEMEFILEEKYYAYGFEVILSERKFISEWLIELDKDNNNKVIFSRDIKKSGYKLGIDFENSSVKNKLEVYIDDIKNDNTVLFLNVMNQNKKNLYQESDNVKIFRNVFDWFEDKLNIYYPNQPVSNYSYLVNPNTIEKASKMLSAFGTDISELKIIDVEFEEVLGQVPKELKNIVAIDMIRSIEKAGHIKKMGMIIRSNKEIFIIDINKNSEIECKKVMFKHQSTIADFNLEEESDGTIRILDLLEILLGGEGKTYIVDELDRCLHPCLTYKFIETFIELAKKENIQIIVTTHESRLMDLELLRRDEIWFVNKEDGISNIYSLEEYNERFDRKVDKAYLEGRYKGIPVFDEVFPV
ncbi:MAG: transporter [Epulopiscium sp. Nele67-Bin004]|nr:MAG: transporter [Epulopiscium sp. Nele67-Bin004]